VGGGREEEPECSGSPGFSRRLSKLSKHMKCTTHKVITHGVRTFDERKLSRSTMGVKNFGELKRMKG
jgi:hypothetical protein